MGRFWLMAMTFLAPGCAHVSSTHYSPEEALGEIKSDLARMNPPYELRGDWILEAEGPLLKELVKKYKDDLGVLERAFKSGHRETRIFALHALSASGVDGFESTYARWLNQLAQERDSDLLVASLWYSFGFNERVVVTIDTVLYLLQEKLLACQALVALRNGAIQPDYDATPAVAKRLFEAVIPHLRPIENRTDDACTYAQQILQAMTTVERRRGYRLLERNPLPPEGPMHERVDHNSRACEAAWRDWWIENRDYLVWIPPKFVAPRKPSIMNGKEAISHAVYKMVHTGRRLGGGFFLLDADARSAAVPSGEYRREHPWKEGQGPLDPRLYTDW